jgi:hypothetical protein
MPTGLTTSVDGFAVGDERLPFAGTVIKSADFSGADPTPTELALLGAEALTITVNITAISGAGATLTVSIDAWDEASQTWVNQLTSLGLTATGATQIYVSHHMTPVANVAAQKPVAPRMRVRPVRSGTTTTLTYSIGAVAT